MRKDCGRFKGSQVAGDVRRGLLSWRAGKLDLKGQSADSDEGQLRTLGVFAPPVFKQEFIYYMSLPPLLTSHQGCERG